MENQYDVGIANRYALFLEEGENSLNVIKKKLSKEMRLQKKAFKKENAEARKVEVSKTVEKPEKHELKPATNEGSLPKKAEGKENKNEPPKSKEKKSSETYINRKDKEPQDKSKTIKNGETSSFEIEITEKETIKSNDNPPRKNFENRKPRERKNDNNESYQSKPFNNQYKKNYNRDEAADKDGSGDITVDRYQNDENRNIKENGFSSHNDYRPRGGGRFRGGNRGGRGNYAGGDRRKVYDQRQEPKEETEIIKSDSWGDDNTENAIENSDNQKDDENKVNDNELSATNEQKEVKEYLTLDEYKKIKGERQKPQYNLRKAGEGEDLTQWKNMRELQKKKDEKFLENGRGNEKNHSGNENEKENAGNENVQRVARQKHIDINVHFREPSIRGRGGRIIRSNRFGYKGRNEERTEHYGEQQRSFRKTRDNFSGGRGNTRQNAPKMDDEHAFPSLG